MDSKRNNGILEVFAKDAEHRKVDEYAVLLLLDAEGDIVEHFGYSKPENVEIIKRLVTEKERIL